MDNSTVFYKMPFITAFGGTTGLVEIPFQNDFVYIQPSVITYITVSDSNANWTKVQTNLLAPAPSFGQLLFVVPIQVDDLINDIYRNYRTVNKLL